VLVLGSSGMLGSRLVPALKAKGRDVIPQTRSDTGRLPCDLSVDGQTFELLDYVKPAVAINLVGLTDVDRCEKQPQLAWESNVRVVESLAAACTRVGSHLIHISTDQVYDGMSPAGEWQARPGNIYALTKYAGELAAKCEGATVLRTNFFGACHHPIRRSLTDWLHQALISAAPIRVFDDVFFSPLNVGTLCDVLDNLIELKPAGIFNLGSRDGMSKADFAYAFARASGLPVEKMTRCLVGEAALNAWRPRDMRMDSTRIEAVLGHRMPRLLDEIEFAAEDYRARV
jgi:dTDP-4-dehydrorhamnose reductase